MSIQVLAGVPLQIESGSTYLFTENFADYPVGTWTAAFWLNMGPNTPVSVAGTTSGTGFLFTLTSTVTAAIAAGIYDFAIYVTSAGQRATAKTGVITILPDLAQVVPATFAQSQVTALESAIATLSVAGNQSVSFNGQSFSRFDIAALQKTLVFYQAQVIAEKNRLAAQRGASDPGRIATRFIPMDGHCTPFPYSE